MKIYMIHFLCILGSIQPIYAEKWNKIQDKSLAKVIERNSYTALFYAMPFEVLPRSMKERVQAVRVKRAFIMKDQNNKVHSFVAQFNSGASRIHFKITRRFKDGFEMRLYKRHANDNTMRIFTLRATSEGWEYIERVPMDTQKKQAEQDVAPDGE